MKMQFSRLKWIGGTGLCIGMLVWLYFVYSSAAPPMGAPLTGADKTSLIISFRGALLGSPTPLPGEVRSQPAPTVVQVWCKGRKRLRAFSSAESWKEIVSDISEKLARFSESRSARINFDKCSVQVDVAVAVHKGFLFRRFAFDPGRDAMGLGGDELEFFLTPSEIVESDSLLTATPIKAIPDLRWGFDDKVVYRQAKREGVDGKTVFRVRTDSFVQTKTNSMYQDLRRTFPVPRDVYTPTDFLAGAIRAGDYITSCQRKSGRFEYKVHLVKGRFASRNSSLNSYNLSRHAGTAFFLAELAMNPYSDSDSVREALSKAVGYLVRTAKDPRCQGFSKSGRAFQCIASRSDRFAKLGATALAIVALVKFQQAMKTNEHDDAIAEMTEWVLEQQKDDGTFFHFYDLRKRSPSEKQSFYYAGQAALALALVAVEWRPKGDDDVERYEAAATLALDAIVGWYNFFLGGFFFGEEHWTCLAANEAWAFSPKAAYLDFCLGYTSFLGRELAGQGSFPSQPELVGGHYVTPFFMPQTTPTSSHTEAANATLALSKKHGRAQPGIEKQISDSLQFVMQMQLTEENKWNAALPNAVGAFSESTISKTVRIDYVQHAGAALLGAAKLLTPRH